MGGYDWLLYSRGCYWLFEHWQENGKNIYSKAKYDTQKEFIKGAGKVLSCEQLDCLKRGESISIKQLDGTTYFFKYVNLVQEVL